MDDSVETVSIKDDSETVYAFYCELCNEDGLHIKAEGFCSDCGEYLCEQCITYHQKTRITRNHEVLGKENMPKDTPPSSVRLRTDISTTCKHHKGKLVELYCKSHDALVCSLCFAADHRSCRDIDNITGVSQSVFSSSEYTAFKHSLKTLEHQVRSILIESRDSLAKFDQCLSDAKGSIKRFKEEIILFLNDLETHLLAQLDVNKAKNIAKGETVSSKCSILQDSIDTITSEFESMESANRVCQTYIRMKETTKDFQDIERQLRQVREDSHVKAFTFVPNEDLRKLLTGPDGLGVISMEDVADQNVSAVSHLHDINVKSSSEKGCWITGSAVLADDKLIVVDHNNCKIKLVDTHSKNVIHELLVAKNPWDVTVIKEDQVAVSINNFNSTVIVLRVTDSITKEREIRVSGRCLGIAYNTNQLFVTYTGPPRVEIMDVQGNITRMIERDENSVNLFKCPQYVCLSRDGDTIYVSDFSSSKVTSFNRDGVVKYKYIDDELKNPEQICLDHRGNVFVCGYKNKNIHMLTPDCTKINTILAQTDGLTNPVQSASHCQRKDRLYIGIEKCDYVKVYQLA